jgi:hypothetical protein
MKDASLWRAIVSHADGERAGQRRHCGAMILMIKFKDWAEEHIFSLA